MFRYFYHCFSKGIHFNVIMFQCRYVSLKRLNLRLYSLIFFPLASLPCPQLTSFAHKRCSFHGSFRTTLHLQVLSHIQHYIHILSHQIIFEVVSATDILCFACTFLSRHFGSCTVHIERLYNSIYRLNEKDLFQYPFLSFLGNLLETGVNKRDIVFLLDGSDDSKNGLLFIREFVRRMVEDLDIDQDIVRVAVIQYSEDVSAHFLLNTFNSKKAVIHAINGLTAKGGRILNTGAALQYVRNHVFTSTSGSRHQLGVPQLMILMTGGDSSDDVASPAEDLKNAGVLSIAIGIKKAVEAELQSIAFSDRFLFNLPVIGELLVIQPDILSFIKSKMAIEPPTIIGKKNYTFLAFSSS